jgi:hypothetical protein
MNKKKMEILTGATIQDLYPSLDEIQAREAEESLDRYLALAMRIHERMRLDPAAYAQLKALTAPGARSTIPEERSNPANQDSSTKQL